MTEAAVTEDGVEGGESSCESGSSSPSCSATVTTSTTRDNSPCEGGGGEGGVRRRGAARNWGDLLPPTEIRTRGAKLPSFAMQLKVRPSRREREELERLLAARCSPSSPQSPPRPLSPKLLRSKAGAGLSQPVLPVLSRPPAPPPLLDPPPVRRVKLESNPLDWPAATTAAYLAQQPDVAHLAPLFLKDDVDGQALLLLNLPSVLQHWQLKLGEAITLSRHIESIKLAFFRQFAFAGPVPFNASRHG